jgi:hypothetical protein
MPKMTELVPNDLPSASADAGSFAIQIVRISELTSFVETFFRHSHGQIIAPISRQRASGMVLNPFASPEDPALLVAYDGTRVIGHYSIVPGLLKTEDGEYRVLWGSALYVHPDYRAGGAVFLELIRTVLSFERDFIISGFTEAVHEIYRVLGFVEPEPLQTCMINVSKLDLFAAGLWLARDRGQIVERTWRLANRLAPALKWIIYYPARAIFFKALARKARMELAQVKFRDVAQVSESFERSLRPPYFVRGARAVNWMIGQPWVRDGACPTKPPYYFHDYREDFFRYHAVEFESTAGVPAGYVVFSVQSGQGTTVMKVTDFGVRDEAEIPAVLWIAMLYASRYRVDHFEAAADLYTDLARIPLASFLVRRGVRDYLCSPAEGGALERVLGQIRLQYGDGDCGFT